MIWKDMRIRSCGVEMTERILRWFADFRNEEVLNMVRDHLELTETAVLELYNMVCSACESPLEKKALYDKVSEVEMKADELRRQMIVKLTERDVFPQERQDLMELVRAIDWVADWAREAGRILVIIPFEKAPEEMKEVPSMPASLDEALDCLEEDYAFLLKGDVFTEELLETYISYKRKSEAEAVRLRPHPYEFALYYDI